jgi:arylformamidase
MKLFLDSEKSIDTNKGIDCSIPLSASEQNPRAWYVDAPKIEAVRANGWVGAVAEGGSVNFRNVFFNPHGHGTHTECLGHITSEVFSINERLKNTFCSAYLHTAMPEIIMQQDGTFDRVISAKHFENLPIETTEALVIRTLPNDEGKKSMNYSETNPPYLDVSVLAVLEKLGVQHLLIDTPSVDREQDGGKLAFHHGFWEVPENPQHFKTITEMIYVPENVEDGNYVLNLQVAPFENDASPSRPILYPIEK